MNDFAAMNEVYGQYFSEPYPARATVQVARLPKDARVEIDVIATFASSDQGRSTARRLLHPDALPALPGPLHVQHAVHAAQRLDHLLEVLEIADLDGHVDPRVLILVGPRASMFLMLVLMSGDLRADGRQQPLPILDLHRQLDGVARDGVAGALSHSTSMRRSGS